MTPEATPQARLAVEKEDAFALAQLADQETIARLKTAEELFSLRQQRRQRSRLALAAQTAVGFVAIAGFFANAYQVFMSTRQQHAQMANEQERWGKEFERASAADKYRAFFETSALATDTANPDKRLVGYALLQEFVADPEYNNKATLMLQEALSQELKRGSTTELAEDTRAAVMAILSALSQTNDCAALTKAAHSIDTVARRLAETHNQAEAQEVYAMYVRRLLGRAAEVCQIASDFRGVRAPLREALVRQTGLTPPIPGAQLGAKEVNTEIAQLLVTRCEAEQQVAGSSDCPAVKAGYLRLCPELLAGPTGPTEIAGCAAIKQMTLFRSVELDGGLASVPDGGPLAR